MASIYLIIVSAVLAAFTLLLVIVLLINFGHPDDVNEAKIPKLVTVVCLWVTFCTVLVLPMDVADVRDGESDLRIDILWQFIYVFDAVALTLMIPFAFFFYENDYDQDSGHRKGCGCKQTFSAFKWMIGFALVIIILLIVLFFSIATADVKVDRIAQSHTSLLKPMSTPLDGLPTACNLPVAQFAGTCLENVFTWEIPVTFPIFSMAFFAFIGWVFFCVFAGVGLVALPMDLINEWRTRPTPMTFQEYSDKKKELGMRAGMLLQAGLQLSKERSDPSDKPRKERRAEEAMLLKFEQAYYLLKRDYDVLRISHELKGGNPLWYVMKLVLGIIGVFLSVTWVFHILVFMLPAKPWNPFLNTFFIQLEGVGGGKFPLFGVVAFGLYAYYLLWCVVKGNFKLGMRLLWFKIYPMELNNTMMNAFLANTWMLMICSLTVVQFCVFAFPIYARLTTADLQLGTQARSLRFFKYFWENNVFIIVMLIFAFCSLVVLTICPKDKAKDIERKIDAVERGDDD